MQLPLLAVLAREFDMGNHSHIVEADALSAAVRTLLRPLVRILLRNGVTFRAFAEQAKRVFVHVALEEFSVEKRKPSLARASVLTGLTRKDVARLAALEGDDDPEIAKRYNRAAWVISGWVRDKQFHDGRGRPASLPIDGARASFAALVRKHSGDMPVRAVLDELTRVGAVRPLRNGRLQLVSREYVPHTGEREKLGILGTDVGKLIATIDHNLTHPRDETFLQLKVEYDNLDGVALPRLREQAKKKGRKLLEELDRAWSKHDRDTNPALEGKGEGRKRAMLGVYYHEEDWDGDEQDD